MRRMLFRSIFAATVLAAAAVGLTSPAHADPSQCPATGCPHLPASTAPGPAAAPAPPPVNRSSASYKDGYQVEHDYFATPRNHSYLASELKNGYSVAAACQIEVTGGTAPTNLNDWLAGCADALHDLGFKP
jgi:hypothetical protein